MNYLQVWLGSDVPDRVYKSMDSLKATMLEGDTYRIITDIAEADPFMNDWWMKSLKTANNTYEKWATYSDMLRINHAILDGDLLYADTDLLLFERPDLSDKNVPMLAYGHYYMPGIHLQDPEMFLFYVNNQTWWFKELLDKMFVLKKFEFAMYHLALKDLLKPSVFPANTFCHRYEENLKYVFQPKKVKTRS